MRTSLKAELLEVAQKVIHIFIFHSLATYRASTLEVPVPELVTLSAKLTVDDVSSMLDSECMAADKGKGVDRLRGNSVSKEDRGRSVNARHTSNNDPDAAISGSHTTSTSPHSSSVPVRRSSRRRAMSRNRVPRTVSELDAPTPASQRIRKRSLSTLHRVSRRATLSQLRLSLRLTLPLTNARAPLRVSVTQLRRPSGSSTNVLLKEE